MADDDNKANVCTFTFKKRRGGTAMRRKADDNDKKSSSEDETVVTRIGKKESAGLLSAKTVSTQSILRMKFTSFFFLLFADSPNPPRSPVKKSEIALMRK